MREIDYNDIKSNLSDNSELEEVSLSSISGSKPTSKVSKKRKSVVPEKKGDKIFSKLLAIQKVVNFETPGEYYKKVL